MYVQFLNTTDTGEQEVVGQAFLENEWDSRYFLDIHSYFLDIHS